MQCTKLRVLDVDGCCELEDLESLEDYICLEKFNASACPKLQPPVHDGTNGR